MLRRLDDARNATGLQVSIVIGIVNAMSRGMGAQMPSDLESQSESFKTKIRPILAERYSLVPLHFPSQTAMTGTS